MTTLQCNHSVALRQPLNPNKRHPIKLSSSSILSEKICLFCILTNWWNERINFHIFFSCFLSSFKVHKKICIPLPGIFQRGRLYKAQSCSSIVRDKVNHSTSTNVDGNKNTPNGRHSVLLTDKNRILGKCLGSRLLGGSDGEINQPQTQFINESNPVRAPEPTSRLNGTTTTTTSNPTESQTNGPTTLFDVTSNNTKTRPLYNNNYLMADCPCVPSNAIVLRWMRQTTTTKTQTKIKLLLIGELIILSF